jgi:hypothetical protein
MQPKLFLNSDLIKYFIENKYPNKCIIAVYLNSADDNGATFMNEIYPNSNKIINQDFCLIEGDEEYLRSLMKMYSNEDPYPYMQLFVNGKFEDENT